MWGAPASLPFMELNEQAGARPERAHFSWVGSGSSQCFQIAGLRFSGASHSGRGHRSGGHTRSLRNCGFLPDQLWKSRVWSGDYANILPGTRQASLSKIDSEGRALVLATLVKSEDGKNYLPQIINQLCCWAQRSRSRGYSSKTESSIVKKWEHEK